MRKFLVFIIGFVAVISVEAQTNMKSEHRYNALKTVYLSDQQLQNFSIGQSVQGLSDSIIQHNSARLSSLLTYNTPIYFKENGRGMVSSPSFRGTTAAQTAVLWNGININSAFNGQTDFNIIDAGNYDNIQLRPGGGSLIYGSSAIGGTVHLNTVLNYTDTDQLDNYLQLQYGSYNTFEGHYRLKWSSQKWSLRLSMGRNSSDNDYKLQQREGRNKNGQYHNSTYNLGFGIRFNKRNELTLYSALFKGNRHFPIYYSSENKTRYKDFNTRNLIKWESRFGRFISKMSAAFLTEEYKYYPHLKNNKHSYGKVETFMGKYNLGYHPSANITIAGVLTHEHTNGQGSDIQKKSRDISSGSLLFKQQLTNNLRYQLGLRQEFTGTYESPFLYSLGIDYQLTPFYTIKLATSRNYRRPTFNDLFWTNSGNPDLNPERSNQVEWGNMFSYKNWKWTITGYFNAVKDMIHWVPESNGLFIPRNEERVQSYGLTLNFNWDKYWNQHHLKFNGSYAYTVSENRKDHQQLIYVPYQKATFSAAYSFDRFSVYSQWLYNGKVYTHADHNPLYILKGYFISNLGLSYKLGHKKHYKIGAKVQNLFNKAYQNVMPYEMPGIHYNFYITLNF